MFLQSKKKNPLTGQTIVEFALILPFFFLFFFTLWEFSFFLVKREIATYAAFMSARSYQVFGARRLEYIETGEEDIVYKATGKQIFKSAFPYFNLENMEIKVDTAAQFPTAEFPELAAAQRAYGVEESDRPGESDVPTTSPKYGILKLEYEHEWFASEGNDAPYFAPVPFRKQIIYVPYRLEVDLKPDFGD